MRTTVTVARDAAFGTTVAQVVPDGRRWIALDLFRFAAVLLMVQGHAFYVLASDAVREAPWYGWHNYVHGYTAPMFLFAAGLAFGVTTFRRWKDHATPGPDLRRRVLRYLMLIGIGYLLHLPSFSLASLVSGSEAQLRTFWKVDALQHIGLTLLACELMVPPSRRPERFVAVCASLGAAAVVAAPALWRLPVERWLPPGLGGYVNANTGSIFPLAPWCGFVFAGVVTAWLVHRARRGGSSWHAFGWRFALAGGTLLLVAAVLRSSLPDLFGEHDYWKTSPWFFLWRLGWVMVVLAALCGLARLLDRRTPRILQVTGQETLVVYVAHLLVLYGSPFHTGFHHRLGRALDLPQAILFVVLLVAAMALLAWAWHNAKLRRPREHAALRRALIVATVAYVALA